MRQIYDQKKNQSVLLAIKPKNVLLPFLQQKLLEVYGTHLQES